MNDANMFSAPGFPFQADTNLSAMKYTSNKTFVCFFCGSKSPHSRENCPAREATCRSCKRTGHFSTVCRSKNSSKLAATGGVKPTVDAKVNNYPCRALLDTGAENNSLDEEFAQENEVNIIPYQSIITLACSEVSQNCAGIAYVKVTLLGRVYPRIRVIIMKNLVANIILGKPFMEIHSNVNFQCGGPEPPLTVATLKTMSIKPPSLFSNLSPHCKPIATRSRRYNETDLTFIRQEVDRLLKNEIIEPSNSPWRAQVLVVRGAKKRMVIDYSATINRYTPLDAYPLPNISDLVNKIAQYSWFSDLDLKSAYHQVPIAENEKYFTAFEAAGSLYQFKRVAFGLTNAVAAFQRVMDDLIRCHDLKDTFVYVDDVIIGGKTKSEHDNNLKLFLNMVKIYNITLNDDKCKFDQTNISVLGLLTQFIPQKLLQLKLGISHPSIST